MPALVAGIHVFRAGTKAWMPGTRPGMTSPRSHADSAAARGAPAAGAGAARAAALPAAAATVAAQPSGAGGTLVAARHRHADRAVVGDAAGDVGAAGAGDDAVADADRSPEGRVARAASGDDENAPVTIERCRIRGCDTAECGSGRSR